MDTMHWMPHTISCRIKCYWALRSAIFSLQSLFCLGTGCQSLFSINFSVGRILCFLCFIRWTSLWHCVIVYYISVFTLLVKHSWLYSGFKFIFINLIFLILSIKDYTKMWIRYDTFIEIYYDNWNKIIFYIPNLLHTPNCLFSTMIILLIKGCSCSGVKVDDWLRAERLAHDVMFDLNNYAQG